jgi:Ser-tRNA(Ala) deacylase AlaX
MDDSYLFTYKGRVLEVSETEDGRMILILDETIFYPQGGGQPYDLGRIENSSGTFEVEEVRYFEGKVHHIGKSLQGEIVVGEEVIELIDEERRILNSKLQTGGHLIDMAMRNLGYDYLKPTKGFHFPEGPNVEYSGVIPEEEREALTIGLEKDLNRMISEGYEVKIQMAEKSELENLCYITPPETPDGKPTRIVAVWDDLFMPCGATHVKNISELGKMSIKKIKCKKGNTKISYLVE